MTRTTATDMATHTAMDMVIPMHRPDCFNCCYSDFSEWATVTDTTRCTAATTECLDTATLGTATIRCRALMGCRDMETECQETVMACRDTAMECQEMVMACRDMAMECRETVTAC